VRFRRDGIFLAGPAPALGLRAGSVGFSLVGRPTLKGNSYHVLHALAVPPPGPLFPARIPKILAAANRPAHAVSARTRTAPAPSFSTDGTQLVTTNNDSSSIHVWDLRAIRQQLAKMGLDWELAPYPPAGPRDIQPPLALSVELGALSPDEAATTRIK